MKNRKSIILVALILILSLASVSLIYSLQVNRPEEPKVPLLPPTNEREVKSDTLVKWDMDQNLIVRDNDSIDIHRMIDEKLFISIQKMNLENPTQYITLELGYIDMNSMEYHLIKELEKNVRIYDYVYINNDLVYSKIGALSDDGVTIEVIHEHGGKTEIVDKMKGLFSLDAPIFALYDSQIFYQYKHYKEDDSGTVTAELAFKSYDMKTVSTIDTHTCEVFFGDQDLYPDGCMRTDGRVYNSGDSIFYKSWDGLSSEVNVYNIKSKAYHAFSISGFVEDGIFLEEINEIWYTIPKRNSNLINLYSISTSKSEPLPVFKNIGFGRPLISGSLLVFTDSDSRDRDQTYVFDIESDTYQIIDGFENTIGFPKYYTYNNKLYAVWTDTSVKIQVFEILNK